MLRSTVNPHLQELRSQISHVLQAQSKGEKTGSTIFSSLLDQDLPKEELTSERLEQEALTLITAGTETVMRALVVASFHIINEKHIMDRLVEELTTAIPDPTNMPDFDLFLGCRTCLLALARHLG